MTYAVYANNIFWGIYEANGFDDAIQAAIEDNIEAGEFVPHISCMYAKPTYEMTNQELFD